MAKDDFYIQLLKMAKSDLTKTPAGISIEDFRERMTKLGVPHTLDHALYERIYLTGARSHGHMGLEAYMMLLEYEELKHSLEESKQARRESKYAIWISIAAIVAQIIFR